MKTKQCCLALSPSHKGALILVRNSSLELLGPGAAIFWTDENAQQKSQSGFWNCGNCAKLDSSLVNVLIIGDVKLEVLEHLSQQKKALWRRATWLNWLNRLQETSCSIQRIESLIQHFNIFFGREVCQSLPSELLASLLGCEELELLWVRDRYFQDWSWENSPRPSKTSWFYLTSERWQEILAQALDQKRQAGMLSSWCSLMDSQNGSGSVSNPSSLETVSTDISKSSPWSGTFSKINPFDFKDSFQFKAV